MIEALKPTQLLRLFVAAWDREHKPARRPRKSVNSRKRKLRKLDPHDWIRTPKRPKAKS